MRYTQAMASSGSLTPLLFCWRTSYDETPLRCRVSFTPGEAEKTEVAKVWVLELSWALLLRVAQQPLVHEAAEHCDKPYMLLTGSIAPSLRCADGMSGEAIASVLSSVNEALMPDSIINPFKEATTLVVRLSESDEAGANSRAERLLKAKTPGWTLLQQVCLAHKVHSTAERTWQLEPGVFTGVIRLLLSLQGSAQWSRFRTAVSTLVSRRLIVRHHALSGPAAQERRRILQTWLEPLKRSRKVAFIKVMAAFVLNGDWRRQDAIEHICAGPKCCETMEATASKVRQSVMKLLSLLKPSTLCKCNWAEWSVPMAFIGLLTGIHALLPAALHLAFTQARLSSANDANLNPLAHKHRPHRNARHWHKESSQTASPVTLETSFDSSCLGFPSRNTRFVYFVNVSSFLVAFLVWNASEFPVPSGRTSTCPIKALHCTQGKSRTIGSLTPPHSHLSLFYRSSAVSRKRHGRQC